MQPFDNKLLSSHTDVSRETLDLVHALIEESQPLFHKLIQQWLRWNRSVNLFSRNTSGKELKEHIFHSLLIHVHMNQSTSQGDALKEKKENTPVLDAGTGGGLPGLPLALVNPDRFFYLNDKVQKKQYALKQILSELGIVNAKTVTKRLEHLTFKDPVWVVSKHSFQIPDLFIQLEQINWERIYLLKGQDGLRELNHSRVCNVTVHGISLNQEMMPFLKNKYLLIFYR